MKFLRRKLKNGITVLMEQRELPIVAVSVSNPFGAAFEQSKIKGIAHVIEHMVFTGTKTRTHEDISKEIEKKGGIVNAFTSHELTSYWFKLPSEHIFAGLDILTDILNNSTFNAEKFEKEKKVILEEIKMYHDEPSRDIYDVIAKNLYESPFGESVIGSAATVSALERDFTYEFFTKHYSPENFLVTIVGKADFDKVCTYLEKNFSQRKQKLGKIFPIKKRNTDSVEERAGIDQAHFILGMHAPLPTEPEFYVLEVLDAYLASGMSSRLFLRIREDLGLAYAVQSSVASERNYSHYTIYTGTTKGAIPKIKEIILEEFKNISKMEEKDMAAAKERLIGLHRLLSESGEKVMYQLLYNELTEKAEEHYNYENRIRAVTLAQVKELAAQIIKKYSTAAIVPK